MYNKKEIMPKVMVYRDAIPDIDHIFKIIKDSESINDPSLIIQPWEKWNTNNGSMSKVKEGIFIGTNRDGTILEQQKYVNETLKQLVKILSSDYLDTWSNTGTWPHVSSFEDLVDCDIDLLKYYKTDLDKKYALYYHTDLKEETLQSRGYKQILTFTIYLNDEYEGGEISYMDEERGVLVTYKPKKGDVTVFPSGPPYFHGVKPITSNYKYLARTFLACWYDGSSEWLENEEKYGGEEWAKISLKNEIEQAQSNIYNRIPLKPDEEYPKSSPTGYKVFRYTEDIGFQF